MTTRSCGFFAISSARNCSSRAARRATSTTVPARGASWTANSRPIPAEAPVTTTVLPSKHKRGPGPTTHTFSAATGRRNTRIGNASHGTPPLRSRRRMAHRPNSARFIRGRGCPHRDNRVQTETPSHCLANLAARSGVPSHHSCRSRAVIMYGFLLVNPTYCRLNMMGDLAPVETYVRRGKRDRGRGCRRDRRLLRRARRLARSGHLSVPGQSGTHPSLGSWLPW